MSDVSEVNSFINTLVQQNIRVECLKCAEHNAGNVLFLDQTLDCPNGAVMHNFQCNLCTKEHWKCPCGDFKQFATKKLARKHKYNCYNKRLLIESVAISKEPMKELIDDVSMDEAITQDLNFDLEDDILPCVSFSEGLKQHDKATKHHIYHLHKKDLQRCLVILANHQGLSHQAHKELLEKEIKMHVKMEIFIRGLGNKQVQQFVDFLGCAETSIVDRRKTTSSTFSSTNMPTSMK